MLTGALFVLAALLGGGPTASASALPDCRLGFNGSAALALAREPVPGATLRCDVTTQCAWCARNHLSLDFLCCEPAGNGYLALHITTPLFIYLVWDSALWTVLAVLLNELAEVLLLALLSTRGGVFAEDTSFETLAASLLGDVLLHGGCALALGFGLRVLFRVPPLAARPSRAAALGPTAVARRVRYIAWFVAQLAAVLLLLASTDAVPRLGLYVYSGVALVFIGGWAYWTSRDALDAQLVCWRSAGDRAGFYASWAFAASAVHLSAFTSLEHVFANDWYQVWSVAAPLAVLALSLALAASLRRDDWYAVYALLATLLYGFAVALLLLHTLLRDTARHTASFAVAGWLALALAVLCTLVFALRRWPVAGTYQSLDSCDNVAQRDAEAPGDEPPLSLRLTSTAKPASTPPPLDFGLKRRGPRHAP